MDVVHRGSLSLCLSVRWMQAFLLCNLLLHLHLYTYDLLGTDSWVVPIDCC